MKNKLKDITKKQKLLFAAIAIIVIAAAIIVVASARNAQQDCIVTISEASLKEVIEVGELSTLEYSYNSYTPVSITIKDKKGNEKEEIKYYVSYKGTVKAGFDFEKLSVNHEEERNTIYIEIPEIKITSTHVDEKSLDYIFVKDKYNTENTFAEALKACEKDLEDKAKDNSTLNDFARDNAISMMNALLAPWKESLPEDCKVEIK